MPQIVEKFVPGHGRIVSVECDTLKEAREVLRDHEVMGMLRASNLNSENTDISMWLSTKGWVCDIPGKDAASTHKDPATAMRQALKIQAKWNKGK